LLAIDHSTFDQMLRQYPEVAIRMLRRITARVREANAAAESAMGGMVAGKIVKEVATVMAMPLPTVEPAPPPQPVVPQKARWTLVFESGATLPLPDQDSIRVGRFDSVTGERPDVDLTTIDVKKTTSRRHARIVREKDRLLVIEEIGTANGTFV